MLVYSNADIICYRVSFNHCSKESPNATYRLLLTKILTSSRGQSFDRIYPGPFRHSQQRLRRDDPSCACGRQCQTLCSLSPNNRTLFEVPCIGRDIPEYTQRKKPLAASARRMYCVLDSEPASDCDRGSAEAAPARGQWKRPLYKT